MQRQGGQTLSWSFRAPEEGGGGGSGPGTPHCPAALHTLAQSGGWGQPVPWAEERRGHAGAHHCVLGTSPEGVKATPIPGGGDSCTTRVCLCVHTGEATSTCMGQCDSYGMLPTGGSLMHHPGGKLLGVMAEPCQGWAPGLHTLSTVLPQWQECCAGAARSQLGLSPTGPRCLPQSRDISRGKWPA